MFSGEVHYLFDNAASAAQLSYDIPLVLMLYAPGDEEIERRARHPRLTENISEFHRYLVERADDIIHGQETCPRVMNAIVGCGLMAFVRDLDGMAAQKAHQLAMEITDYGSRAPTKKAIRRSLSHRPQWDFIKQDETIRVARQLTFRLHRLAAAFHYDPDFETLQRLSDAYWQEDGRTGVSPPPTWEQRAAFRRASKLAKAVVGESVLTSFLKGEDVFISGKRFVFQVNMQHVFKVGHGCIDLRVCDHDHKTLADLCLYFTDTPTIDQLIAIHLYAQAGMEDDLLGTANIIKIHEAATSHAAFQAVVTRKRSNVSQLDFSSLINLPQNAAGTLRHEEWSLRHSEVLQQSMRDKIFTYVCYNQSKVARRFQDLVR